ncbi:MAG: type III pantothenate kinase [Methylococcales bacterium]
MAHSLLIDIGNSRLKWAFHSADGLTPGMPMALVDGKFDFSQIWNGLHRPSRILVSSVLGDSINHSLRQWTEHQWSVPIEFVRSREKAHGVTNGYLNPKQLGVDRWVAMIAARGLYQEAVLIVDCGTAITADVLDGLGHHQGGVICPGVGLMRDALLRKSPALVLPTQGTRAVLGRDTGTGIASGTWIAAAGLIEKFLDDAQQLLGSRLKLLVTGGDAALVSEKLRVDHVHIPDMVLTGLARIESLRAVEAR